MRNAASILVIGMAWLAAGPWEANAQDAAADSAVVLGGGGARGLAHGGVVVALQRLGRSPGIVVGTSMGSVVGALYAAGYEPDEIWRIIAGEDWPALYAPPALVVGPDRETRYPILSIGAGPRPAGLVPDHRINRRLTRLLFDAQARVRGDFDRLPRRFRAVAADLVTGRRAVLGSGDLALAVRASIAVPGAFAPVRWDGRWLVDGGIRDNLAVGVARALGGRHVVAVDVIRPPPTIEETDPLSIGLRGLRLLIGNAGRDAGRADVTILPRIPPEVSEAGFPRDPLPLLRAGFEATMTALDSTTTPAPAPAPLPPPPDSLGAPVVITDDPALRALALRTFAGIAPGPYDADAVLDAADRLYATGLFSGVWTSVESAPEASIGPDRASPDGAPRLRIQLETVDRTLVTGAVGYDNDRGGRLWAVLRHRLALGAPTVVGLAVSGHRLERWATASIRRISPGYAPLAWNAGGGYREATIRDFAPGGDERDVIRAGGWAGAELRNTAPEWVASAVLRAEHIAVEDGRDGPAFGPYLRWSSIVPPTRAVGTPAHVEAEARFGEFEYRRARIGGAITGSANHIRFAVIADAAAVRGDAPVDAWPALGDERRMPGYEWGRGRSRGIGVGGIDIAYPIPLEGFARLRLRVAATGDRTGSPGADTTVAGAELGTIWPTPFGTVLVAAGAASDGRWRVDVDLGPAFQ